MLLPTKGVTADRALVFVGAEILRELDRPTTVSALWTAVQSNRRELPQAGSLTYDWFVLALDWLYAVGAVHLDNYSRITRGRPTR